MMDNVDNLSSQTPAPDIPNIQTSKPEQNSKIKFSIVDKWKEIMKAIKEKTGIDGIYVIIFLSLCVLLVHLGIFESLITSLVGTLYPGFCTIKAIQKKQNKKDWLTYWVIFGSFLIFDSFSSIFMRIFHFYFVAKILFLIWMFLPGSNGCRLVYDFLIAKVLASLESFFDKFFQGAKEMKNEITIKFNKNVRRNITNNNNNINNNNSMSVAPKPINKGNLIPEIKKEEEKLKEIEEHIKFQKELEDMQQSRKEDNQNEKKEENNNNIMLSDIILDDKEEENNKEEGETKINDNLNNNENKEKQD